MSSVGFWWFGVGFLILATLIQGTFLGWIRISEAQPDLFLIVLVWFSLDLRLASALALGLVAAALRLATTGEPMLYILISFLSVSGFTYWAAHQLVREDLWVQVGLLGVEMLSVYTMGFVWFYPVGSFDFLMGARYFFSHVILPTLYTMGIAPFCWRWMNQFLIRCGWESFTEST